MSAARKRKKTREDEGFSEGYLARGAVGMAGACQNLGDDSLLSLRFDSGISGALGLE